MEKIKFSIIGMILLFSEVMIGGNTLTDYTDTANVKTQEKKADIPFLPKVEIGVRFIPTFSSLNVQTADGGKINGDVTLNYAYEAFLGIYIGNHIGIQAEVIYNSLSQKYRDLDLDRKIKINYVNVPVLLSLNTRKGARLNLNAVFGPQFGFNVGATMETTGTNGTYNSQAVFAVRKNDLDLAYGAGFDVALNSAHTIRFGLGYRGVSGLMDIGDHSKSLAANEYYVLDNSKIKTNSGYIGLSVLF